MQLHRPEALEQLAACNARLLVLSFAPLERLQAWIPHFLDNFLWPAYQEAGLQLPGEFEQNPFARTKFLSDPALLAYHAYGLGRNTPEEIYSRKILRQYARWRAQGKPVQPPQEDPLQRGGNFVIGPSGRLIFAHSGRDQSERPTLTEFLQNLKPTTG